MIAAGLVIMGAGLLLLSGLDEHTTVAGLLPGLVLAAWVVP